jgi:hypothetical protein
MLFAASPIQISSPFCASAGMPDAHGLESGCRRTGRPCLRRCGTGQGRQRGSASSNAPELTGRNFHSSLPGSRRILLEQFRSWSNSARQGQPTKNPLPRKTSPRRDLLLRHHTTLVDPTHNGHRRRRDHELGDRIAVGEQHQDENQHVPKPESVECGRHLAWRIYSQSVQRLQMRPHVAAVKDSRLRTNRSAEVSSTKAPNSETITSGPQPAMIGSA